MSVTPEIIALMQKQLQETQQLLAQVIQQQGNPTVDANNSVPHPPPSTEDNAMEGMDTSLPIHSIAVRQQFDWQPQEELSEILRLGQPIFQQPPMADSKRKELIESYPPIRQVDYKAPATIPVALKQMNKGQQREDSNLKDLQYLLSGALRPLDILGHEIFQSPIPDNEAQRFLHMLGDVRSLLINVCSTINTQRNHIALRSVNQNFSAPIPAAEETRYTMPLDAFQASLVQQTTAAKALKDATALGQQGRSSKPARRFKRSGGTEPPSSSASPGLAPSSFRQGPSSQQGGYFQGNKKNVHNSHTNNHSKRQ